MVLCSPCLPVLTHKFSPVVVKAAMGVICSLASRNQVLMEPCLTLNMSPQPALWLLSRLSTVACLFCCHFVHCGLLQTACSPGEGRGLPISLGAWGWVPLLGSPVQLHGDGHSPHLFSLPFTFLTEVTEPPTGAPFSQSCLYILFILPSLLYIYIILLL